MSDTSDTTTGTTTEEITNTILSLLNRPDDPALLEAQALLARRIASSAAIAPVRVPAPQNITEMGGYLNLLERAGEETTRLQAVSAALGLAGPLDAPHQPGGPDIGFTRLDGLRVTEAAQAVAPAQIEVRMDFAGPLKTAVDGLAARGFELPLLNPRVPLPAFDAAVPDAAAMMALLGRSLRIAPSVALSDPAVDSVLVVNGASGIEVHLRQVIPTTTQAGDVAQATLDVFTCDGSSCTSADTDLLAEPLAPALAVAGWFPGPRSVPTTLSEPGDWTLFFNATGLIIGESTFGDELARLHPGHLIAASSARHALPAVWDGIAFVM